MNDWTSVGIAIVTLMFAYKRTSDTLWYSNSFGWY